jgi:glycine/D-amino acid oxidase-like deaminating enzyme
VCAISSTGPLPADPADVAADDAAHARLEALCRNISPVLAAAPIKAWQTCFRPVTEDGLPFIGAVPGVDGAYHYSCVLFEVLNRWATMIREIMDGWRIG